MSQTNPKAMSSGNESQLSFDASQAGLLQDLTQKAWKSRRTLLMSLVIGAVLGGAAAYLLPAKHVAKLEIRRAAVENYGSVFAAVSSTPSSTPLSGDAAAEIGGSTINAAVADSLVSMDVFAKVYQQATGIVDEPDLGKRFGKTISYRELIAPKGLEKSFAPGFAVDVTLRSRVQAHEFAKLYGAEIEKLASEKIKEKLVGVIKVQQDLNNLNIDLARQSFELKSEIDVQKLGDAISVSKVGGIEKPVFSTVIPMSMQIPIESAVPRYFFGSEILEREKQITETNSKDIRMVPDYAELIALESRLKGLSKLLNGSGMRFVEVRAFPSVVERNGLGIRLALAAFIAVAIFVLMCIFVLMRGYVRDLETADRDG
jgi:hypothetical protein